MRRAAALAAVLAILAAAILVVAKRSQEETESVIPWREIPISDVDRVPRYVPPVPEGAKDCRAQNLRVETWGPQGLNSAQSHGALTLTNVGADTCALDGRPSLRVPARAPASVEIAEVGDFPMPPGFPANGARFGLRPGQTASGGYLIGQLCNQGGP